MTERRPNRLAAASSPYLLQHAYNPVDWYPWGDEAFARARERDVPVFLSVGYAACHWCHVMERESFEDDATAAFLNEHFVSIKVDREERPDVDAIYMDAVQAMTGGGGWPMSVFLTPAGRPFYAGTYYPDIPRHGMPSFRQVLEGLADAWTTQRAEVEEQGGHVAAAIARTAGGAADAAAIEPGLADDAVTALRRSFDDRWGGFGIAPKFPQPMVLDWLLRQHARGRDDVGDLLRVTLDRMADGGMHDQVGGGFARYSTDAHWHVPHFEKMLTDNAQLLMLYTDAWLALGADGDRDVAERTTAYLLRELQLPGGGFATSQDADSDGVEGAFFVWSWDELVRLVGEPVADAFGARPEGNWEGTNVLWHPEPLATVATRHAADVADLQVAVRDARALLFDARAGRTAPATDDKVLAGANGLAIRALAHVGRALDLPPALEAAERAAAFIWDALRDANERLLRSWRGTPGPTLGFLDDHALLGLGLLGLYEATGDPVWFERARHLGDEILARFVDEGAGGFYLTADDAERLIVRPKEILDTATPSGQSAAAELLVLLALFTGEAPYEDAAARAIATVVTPARRHPTAFGRALCVADLLVGPTAEIAIVAPPGTDAGPLLREVRARYLPQTVLATAATDDSRAAAIVPLLRDRVAAGGRPTAYVCERFVCRMPVTEPDELAALLG